VYGLKYLILGAVLEDITGSTRLYGLADEPLLIIDGNSQNLNLRAPQLDGPNGRDTTHSRHQKIHEDHIYPTLCTGIYGLFATGHHGLNHQIRFVLQKGVQALADHLVVVSYQ
jgi:hypothetical protein